MKKHHEVEIGGEIVYLRKTFLGWGVIFPYKINNKINWKNLISSGSWIKLIIVISMVLIILGCISEYSTAVNLLNECLSNKTIW